MTLCVKNCTGVDPISGQYSVPFGKSRSLPPNPIYKWVDGNGNRISSVKCDYKDFGKKSESIGLNYYAWDCAPGYNKNPSSNICYGKNKIP